MALAFSTACSPCNAMGPGRPPYRLPIAVAARPQYAIAQSGSFWAAAMNVLAAAGNENACSIASARSNSPWTPALQAIGKCTFPKSSRALACGAAITRQETISAAKRRGCGDNLSIHMNVLIVGPPYRVFFAGEPVGGHRRWLLRWRRGPIDAT